MRHIHIVLTSIAFQSPNVALGHGGAVHEDIEQDLRKSQEEPFSSLASFLFAAQPTIRLHGARSGLDHNLIGAARQGRSNRNTSMKVAFASEPKLDIDIEAMKQTLPEEGSIPETMAIWRELGFSDSAIAGLHDIGIREPSPIQKVALPALLNGADALLAAGTGSGKTLAYLLPIVQQLRNEEFGLQPEEMARLRRPKRPRAVVLVPTRELALQVTENMKKLSHFYKVSSAVIIGGELPGKHRKKLERPVDVLIATPGRLLKYLKAGDVYFGSVRHFVIDEVDFMLTQGFGADLKAILGPYLNPKNGARPQYIACTATVTKALRMQLKNIEGDYLPKLREVHSADLHRSNPNVHHRFRHTHGKDKIEVLLEVLRAQKAKKKERRMVFCHNVKSAQAISHSLRESGFWHVPYYSEMKADARKENLRAFIDGSSAQRDIARDQNIDDEDMGDLDAFFGGVDLKQHNEDDFPILVCSDIASRGLDIPNVDHVINFDFPTNTVDYLHRAGRTGRLNPKKGPQAQAGTVTNIINKHSQTLANAIEKSLASGKMLDDSIDVKDDWRMGNKLRKASLRQSRSGVTKDSEDKTSTDKSSRHRRKASAGHSEPRSDDRSRQRHRGNTAGSRGQKTARRKR